MAKADASEPEWPLPLDKFQCPSDDSEPCRRSNRIVAAIRDDLGNLPEALLDLLTEVIKPLFSAGDGAHQPRVTPAGRKPAYAPPLSTLPHSSWSAASSIHAEPAWRLPLTVPLLQWILRAYRSLRQPKRRQALEAQFPLLIPPILKLIDDVPSSWRADGFLLLQLLGDAITSAESDILKRTGLIDVCFDAVKANFMLLPTLTPEDESLQVLRQLYPASLSLVRARFGAGRTSGEEENQRQRFLNAILRHGLLASLTHLGVGSPSISHAALAAFLLGQLIATVKAMGLPAVAHLNRCIPMLRSILIDPFVPSVPELLEAALDGMATMIETCSPRIKDRWWPECLYGLVGCWCNIVDDNTESTLMAARDRVRAITLTLGEIVDVEEWQQAVTTLCREDRDIESLFARS